MTTKTTEYPFPTNHLEKGSMILPETIEEAFGIPRSSRKFGLALLKAREHVERSLARRGLVVTTISVKDSIRILTPSEEAEYHDRRFSKQLSGAGHHLRRQAEVNEDELSDEEREKHRRNLYVNGKTYQAARRARRRALMPSKHERMTPRIGGDNDVDES